MGKCYGTMEVRRRVISMITACVGLVVKRGKTVRSKKESGTRIK